MIPLNLCEVDNQVDEFFVPALTGAALEEAVDEFGDGGLDDADLLGTGGL